MTRINSSSKAEDPHFDIDAWLLDEVSVPQSLKFKTRGRQKTKEQEHKDFMKRSRS